MQGEEKVLPQDFENVLFKQAQTLGFFEKLKNFLSQIILLQWKTPKTESIWTNTERNANAEECQRTKYKRKNEKKLSFILKANL